MNTATKRKRPPNVRLQLTETQKQKFWRKVDKLNGDAGCWLWTGFIRDGYGRFHINRNETPRMAHRIAYTLCCGEIPNGMTLDHLCKVTHCVNPLHLEPVTLRENINRGNGISARNYAKLRCPKGHEYDGLRKGNWRVCKKCRNASSNASYYRNRDKILTRQKAYRALAAVPFLKHGSLNKNEPKP
jgi:hypothetical protein